jgi:hypothetical protein
MKNQRTSWSLPPGTRRDRDLRRPRALGRSRRGPGRGVMFAMNAPNPELVTAEEFSRAPGGWNGRPVFEGHPLVDGKPVSGNLPEVLEAKRIGIVFNTGIKKKKLVMEAWLDIAACEERAPELLRASRRATTSRSASACSWIGRLAGHVRGQAVQGRVERHRARPPRAVGRRRRRRVFTKGRLRRARRQRSDCVEDE